MRKLWVILLTLNSVAATDVAVIIGGQDAKGNSINLTEFYTENTDSCIYNEDFLAMKDIFNFQPPENDGNLAGVFVDNDAMFLCPILNGLKGFFFENPFRFFYSLKSWISTLKNDFKAPLATFTGYAGYLVLDCLDRIFCQCGQAIKEGNTPGVFLVVFR